MVVHWSNQSTTFTPLESYIEISNQKISSAGKTLYGKTLQKGEEGWGKGTEGRERQKGSTESELVVLLAC